MRAARWAANTALVLASVVSVVHAQDSGNVVTSTTKVFTPLEFDVAASGIPYPPRSFPAYYPLTNFSHSTLSITTYNESSTPQVLMLKALPFEADGPLLDQLEYRVNGGDWMRASSYQVVGLNQQAGWKRYDVEFRLRLTGNENAGSYLTSLTWQLSKQ